MSKSGLHSRQPGTDEAKSTTRSRQPYGRHARVRERSIVVGRVLIAVATVAIVVLAGTGWWLWTRANDQIQEKAVAALVPDDPNIRQPTTPAGEVDPQAPTPENLLIMGVTPRSAGTAGQGAERTDIMMLVHASADRSRIDLVSIPGDLLVGAPSCKTWDPATRTATDVDYVSSAAEWEIAEAYAAGGPPCAVRAVQALTGLRVDRVIIIDEGGFKAIVDTMGGITVKTSSPIVVDGQTVLEAGESRLITGDEALTLIDSALSGGTLGGLDAVSRQRLLVAAMLSQFTSNEMLSDPARLNSTLQAVIANSVTANVTVDDLAALALSLKGEGSEISDFTLPSEVEQSGDGRRTTALTGTFTEALVEDQPLPSGGQ